MRRIKYRHDGGVETLTLPAEAELLIACDADGAEIYEGDTVGYRTYYDYEGQMQEHTLSAALSVIIVDETGDCYGMQRGQIKCVL